MKQKLNNLENMRIMMTDDNSLTYCSYNKIEGPTLPKAIDSCRKRKSIFIQSAPEIAFLRYLYVLKSSPGVYHYHLPQFTRTVAVFFIEDKSQYYAFDDLPDYGKNLLLSHTEEDYVACEKKGKWEIPRGDSILEETIKRAKLMGRIVPVDLANNRELGLDDGEFEKNLFAKAIFQTVTEHYKETLTRIGYSKVGIDDRARTTLNEDRAIVYFIRLGQMIECERRSYVRLEKLDTDEWGISCLIPK